MSADLDLLHRAASGDRDAFAAIVSRYQRLVVGVAFSITGDRALAQDIGQEAFCAAWRSLHTLDNRANAGPWLAGIARNLANSALRKHARRKSLEPAPEMLLVQTPLDHVAIKERDALVRQTIDKLPVDQREALVLFYFEDRSVESVATGLGVSRDVIKQRLHRARHAMREQLGSALEAMRPTAAFTGLVVSAISILGVTKATAATTSSATAAKGMLMITKLALFVGTVATVSTLYVVQRGVSDPLPSASISSPIVQHPSATPERPEEPTTLVAEITPPRLPIVTPSPVEHYDTPIADTVPQARAEKTGEVRGHVTATTDKAPVADANVSLSPGGATTVTKPDGSFQIEGLAAGDYQLTVKKSGFKDRTLDVTIDEDGVTIKLVDLEP